GAVVGRTVVVRIWVVSVGPCIIWRRVITRVIRSHVRSLRTSAQKSRNGTCANHRQQQCATLGFCCGFHQMIPLSSILISRLLSRNRVRNPACQLVHQTDGVFDEQAFFCTIRLTRPDRSHCYSFKFSHGWLL